MKKIARNLVILLGLFLIIGLSACGKVEEKIQVTIDNQFNGYFTNISINYYNYEDYQNNEYKEITGGLENKTFLMSIEYSIDGTKYTEEIGDKYKIYVNYAGGTAYVENANTSKVVSRSGQYVTFEFTTFKEASIKKDKILIKFESRNYFVSEVSFCDSKLKYIGSYPQSKETNEETISELNELAGPTNDYTKWKSYPYSYNKTSLSSSEDYSVMIYQDIDLEGDGFYDYRGVYITRYRERMINDKSADENPNQKSSGYETKVIYWFKYEPIKWDIISNGSNTMLITNLILDAQQFDYNYSRKSYGNNYANSSIRTWLLNDFYSVAFTASEKMSFVRNNDGNNDGVFLMSFDQINNCYKSKSEAQAKATDYAKIQGVDVIGEEWSPYWLRTAYTVDGLTARAVNYEGYFYDMRYEVKCTAFGVRPCCIINE